MELVVELVSVCLCVFVCSRFCGEKGGGDVEGREEAIRVRVPGCGLCVWVGGEGRRGEGEEEEEGGRGSRFWFQVAGLSLHILPCV